MNRSEILDELDPEWRDRWNGDVDTAWNFYSEFASDEIARVRRENR